MTGLVIFNLQTDATWILFDRTGGSEMLGWKKNSRNTKAYFQKNQRLLNRIPTMKPKVEFLNEALGSNPTWLNRNYRLSNVCSNYCGEIIRTLKMTVYAYAFALFILKNCFKKTFTYINLT